jgi:membrane-bound ClpP family serine protease
MIDPFTAFAAVQSAVALIKKASETVDDVASLGPLIGKYFEAKHEATKAVNEAKVEGGSNLGKAIEIELALKAQRDFEKQLSDLFFSTNNMDVWNSIKKRASDMDREAIDLKRKADALQKVRRQEREETIQWIMVALISVILAAFTVFMIASYFDATKG